ncbi:C1 family peptidase [Haliangium sp.]|uniref:C1 family peptidase n=1 Tax=Haliangium sp. TaxID=2663208 RepID=UPI003D11CF0D
MSHRVIAIPGKALPDRDMRVWDKDRQAFEDHDWGREDRPFAGLAGALRPRAGGSTGEHVIPEHTPISDQGQRGTCVANAWMDALEILMGLESPGRVVQLSRLFVYWTGRVLVGLEKQDRGVFLRAVAHQLRKIGVVEESYLPYRDSLDAVLAPPPLHLYTMASNNRINSFYRIEAQGRQKLDEIELAVRANHPVVSAAPVDQAFLDYRGGGQVMGVPGASLGLHAMIIVGVREVAGRRQFLRRNSWGSSWGDDGRAWCDQDYVALDDDIWVGTRLPGLI